MVPILLSIFAVLLQQLDVITAPAAVCAVAAAALMQAAVAIAFRKPKP